MSFTLGVIVADTQFERPAGDAGSAASYAHPVIFHVVHIAAKDVVRPEPNPDLVTPYLEGALELQHKGAAAITTTCGFLSPLQRVIAEKLNVPFVASSLLQIPLVHALVQGRIGLITANDEALTKIYLAAAGVDERTPVAIVGLQRYEDFAGPILRDEGEVDFGKVERVVAGAAQDLVGRHPDIRAFVCECHNLAPFGPAIQRQTRKPVFDILTLLAMVAQASSKPAFPQSRSRRS